MLLHSIGQAGQAEIGNQSFRRKGDGAGSSMVFHELEFFR